MTRRWILGAFLVVCAVQLAVPALMIRTYEATLERGRPYKVRCAPMDPADAFRGRYVWLSLEVPAPEGYAEGELTWGRKMWALLEELTGAIAPAVRKAVGVLPSGRIVTPLGDTAISYDPIAAQGANSGVKQARHLVDAIVARDERPFDAQWMTSTFDAFWNEHARRACARAAHPRAARVGVLAKRVSV